MRGDHAHALHLIGRVLIGDESDAGAAAVDQLVAAVAAEFPTAEIVRRWQAHRDAVQGVMAQRDAAWRRAVQNDQWGAMSPPPSGTTAVPATRTATLCHLTPFQQWNLTAVAALLGGTARPVGPGRTAVDLPVDVAHLGEVLRRIATDCFAATVSHEVTKDCPGPAR